MPARTISMTPRAWLALATGFLLLQQAEVVAGARSASQILTGMHPCAVQRLSGGVLMGDGSVSMCDSSDLEQARDPCTPERLSPSAFPKERESGGAGRLRSNVLHESTSRSSSQPQPSAAPLHASVDLMQRAQDAERIPMGGGAALLTPMVARHVTRMARTVFKKEFSPVLQNSVRFASSVASPFRMSWRLSEAMAVTSPALGTPRPTVAGPQPDVAIAQATQPDNTSLEASHDNVMIPARTDGVEFGAPGITALQRLGLVPGKAVFAVRDWFATAFRAGVHAYAALKAVLAVTSFRDALRHGAYKAVQMVGQIDWVTVGGIVLNYLTPGVLYALQILLWASLHALKAMAIVLIDSFSPASQLDPGSPRPRPSWTSPTPFPRAAPVPVSVSWLTPAKSLGSPPPRYSSLRLGPKAEGKPDQEDVSKKHKAGGFGGGPDHVLVEELARQHRERLFRRDGAVSAAAPAREELTWEQRARKAEMDVIRLRQQLQALAQPATSLSQTSAATTKETDASTWAGVLCDQTLLDTGQGAGSPSAASCRPRGDFFFGTPKVQRAHDRAASEQMDTQRERDGGWKGVPGPSPPPPPPPPSPPGAAAEQPLPQRALSLSPTGRKAEGKAGCSVLQEAFSCGGLHKTSAHCSPTTHVDSKPQGVSPPSARPSPQGARRGSTAWHLAHEKDGVSRRTKARAGNGRGRPAWAAALPQVPIAHHGASSPASSPEPPSAIKSVFGAHPNDARDRGEAGNPARAALAVASGVAGVPVTAAVDAVGLADGVGSKRCVRAASVESTMQVMENKLRCLQGSSGSSSRLDKLVSHFRSDVSPAAEKLQAAWLQLGVKLELHIAHALLARVQRDEEEGMPSGVRSMVRALVA